MRRCLCDLVICDYPVMPPPHLRSVYLLGTYGWRRNALNCLNSGRIALASSLPGQPTDEKLAWQLAWIQLADTVACWIDGPEWDRFDLGLCVGRQGGLIIGCTDAALREQLSKILTLYSKSGFVLDTYDEWRDRVGANI